MGEAILFYPIAGLILLSSAMVAFSKNIVHSAFSLLLSFFGVALLYALLSSDFLAVAQLVIYVGGILVLMLFAVMLTSRIHETRGSNPSRALGPGLLVTGLCWGVLAFVAIQVHWAPSEAGATFSPTTHRLGRALLEDYLFPFELASIVLLVGLIGAVMVARKDSPSAESKGEAP